MKKYRPYTPGFILLYALVALCLVDSVYSIYRQVTGTMNDAMQSFMMFTYLIAALGVAYAYKYARSVVAIGDGMLHIVFTAYIKAQEGAKRPFFLFRQGNLDIRTVDKTFPLNTIARYGYVEDLGYSRVDAGNATENTPIFPVREVCFLTTDGKRYHMNAANYNLKQQKDMFTEIERQSGVSPEGSLVRVLREDPDKLKAELKVERKAEKAGKRSGKGKKK